MTDLQNKVFTVNNPVEVDYACEEIRKLLANNISWLSHPYHIAQRFYKKTEKGSFFYPETYIPDTTPEAKNYTYHRLTPDNDYKGMCFFMINGSRSNSKDYKDNILRYSASVIFSVNLELISKARLKEYLFTPELMKEVRKLLIDNGMNFNFAFELVSETRDLKEVYREFILDDLEQYNRAPLQCFRFDFEITLNDLC